MSPRSLPCARAQRLALLIDAHLLLGARLFDPEALARDHGSVHLGHGVVGLLGGGHGIPAPGLGYSS